ncbi:ankyrin repeat domain-containing protein 7-like [Rousettus aegyptiacus]|uniref:ankyrin repeat domain-containing protein 7-like n=1 Tax=Rousettus aegyptiacus TaxID=9407 RepID=UPI00168D85BC|nr:ankyrin repeat domain-containing protein 7-like [Rousettus aegyptiacus]
MRKFFGFGSQKGKLSSTIQQRNDADTAPECSSRITSGPKYHILDKDLGKIHKAASTGNIQKVQEILLLQENGLNDRDKKNRTVLHLACASGHPEVVTLLVDQKCTLNLCDNDNRTALIKAIQCQEKECTIILLERGADPNIMDIDGNMALHYAVAAQNMDMAAKLHSYKADIEASNKDELTPLLLAVNEKKQQMVEFLVKRNANVHAVDKMKRTSLMLAVNDSTSDIIRLLLQQGVDIFSQDNCGWTAEEHAFKRGLNFRLIKPDTDDSWPESDDEDFCFETKEEDTKPAIGNEENGINIIESAPQEQTNNDNLC